MKKESKRKMRRIDTTEEKISSTPEAEADDDDIFRLGFLGRPRGRRCGVGERSSTFDGDDDVSSPVA